MVEKHKTLSLVHVPLVTFGFLLIGVALATLSLVKTSAQESLPSCSGSIQIVNPAPGQVIDDTFSLELFDESSQQTLREVRFLLGSSVVGSANQDTVNTGFWSMEWDTTSVENGDYQLRAEVVLEGPNETCATAAQQVVVDNDAAENGADLEVQILQEEWYGPTNVNFQFEAVAFLENANGSFSNVSENTTFMWTTTIGSVNSAGRFGDFFSGPQAGIGEVKVLAQYGGQMEETTAIVDIAPSGNNFSYPDIMSDVSEIDPARPDGEGSARSRIPGIVSEQTQGDRVLANCIQGRLGEDAYAALIASRSRFTQTQFTAARTCFAEREFVIPSNLAPVDPSTVSSLSHGSSLEITELSNVVAENGKDTLLLAGTTEPNAEVLVYVFSEPLVLTTVADGEGAWSYTLDDPLAPGDHEAYVLSASNGQFERSAPFAFAIAQSELTDSNPNGYGLTLISTDGSQTTTYIAVVAFAVLLASLLLTRFVWFKHAVEDETNESSEEMELVAAALDTKKTSAPKKPAAKKPKRHARA